MTQTAKRQKCVESENERVCLQYCIHTELCCVCMLRDSDIDFFFYFINACLSITYQMFFHITFFETLKTEKANSDI